jgi:imidazolonepropionase-like amidohydrolase
VDVIIATGKILSLIESSKTISFIDSIRSHGLKILKISVQDQLVMPGLIDVHVHAIGGGGEQGLFVH